MTAAPTATDTGAPDNDGAFTEQQFEAELAELRAQQARSKYLQSIDKQDEEEQRQARRLRVLERWDAAGAGDLPLVNSPEEYAALPLDRQLAIEAADPELAAMLAPAQPLPGGTELRMARGGIDHLLPEDVPHLLAAHRGDLVAQLRRRHEEQLWAAHEQSAAALAEQQAAMQAQWAEAQRAGLERFNEQQRALFADRARQGIA